MALPQLSIFILLL